MDGASFEALVARLERQATARPRLYKAQALGLAALGYGFLALMVLVLIALAIGAALSAFYLKALGIKLFIVSAAFLLAVLRALWVRLEAPAGERLTRAEAPALFAMLERLRQRLKTPRIHHVRITPEFNAAVAQIPRLGLFGWHSNHLLIGLPLLQALTQPQFEAVLAHELGHLSRGHARASNWIYRLRLIWLRLEAALSESAHPGSLVFRSFYRWYVPYFQAFSFPLARANEYEADAAAASLTSTRVAAQALTSVSVIGAFLSERYWPGIHAAARDVERPAFAPYSSFGPDALASMSEADTLRWIDVAMKQATSVADTHPCLRDRLSALQAAPELVMPGASDGADRLLGSSLAPLQTRFDARWREAIAESWRRHYEETGAKRQALAALRATAGNGTLDTLQMLELADLEEAVGLGSETALTLRRLARERSPDSIDAQFALARQLLMAADAEGVPLMEDVIGREADALVVGGMLLRDYFWGKGEQAVAAQWHQRSQERAAAVRGARDERARITTADRWLPHALHDAALQQLSARLRQVPGLRRAYLVRKSVRFLPEQPLYVVAFGVTPWYRPRDRATGEAVMQQLRDNVTWPGETFILNIEMQPRALRNALQRKAARIL
jgi:Zn-dependent protease with chaperone function